MSKSLNAKVITEIERRETARIKEETMMERSRNEATKVTIMSLLDKEFSSYLAEFLDFSSYEINDFAANYNHKFRQNAEELGFKFEIKEKDRHSSYDRYVLTIPELRKATEGLLHNSCFISLSENFLKKEEKEKFSLLQNANV